MRCPKRLGVLAGMLAVAILVAPALQAAPKKAAQKPAAKAATGARGARGPAFSSPQAVLDNYAKMLNLSAAQKAKAKPIIEGQMKQAKAIQQGTKLTPQQKGQKMQALFAGTQAKLRKLLTAQQLRKLEDMESGLDGMTRALGLSEAQKGKLRPILAKQRAAATKLFADTKTPQDKKLEKMRALGKTYEGQIKKVLTPAQQKKWAALAQQMMGRGPAGKAAGRRGGR